MLPTLTVHYLHEIWDSLLQCCNACTWTHLEQQNTEKLYGTKNNFMHGQWDKFRTKDAKKQPTENATATSQEPGAKAGYCPCPPLTPGHTLPSPNIMNKLTTCLPPNLGNQQPKETCLFLLLPAEHGFPPPSAN